MSDRCVCCNTEDSAIEGEVLCVDCADYLRDYTDEIKRLEQKKARLIEVIKELRYEVWMQDIPSSTCPEYIEHHESIQKILRFIDDKLLKGMG